MTEKTDDVTTVDLVLQDENKKSSISLPQSPSFLNMKPKEMVAFAREVADALKDIIDKQKLYINIQGKKYVKVEGWTTLGSLLGILPVEDYVKELEDGSYEAKISLIRTSDGRNVGAASALCGNDEARWRRADRYARRSMAATRATGKAYRLAFSWIIALAGYDPTPAEELPAEPDRRFDPPRNDKPELAPAAATGNSFFPDEIYKGAEKQKKDLMRIFNALGIKDETYMKNISNLAQAEGWNFEKIVQKIKMDIWKEG